jgi:AdoMet-dependent heme synthase
MTMKLSAPLTTDINITGRCNYNCSFCSASPTHSPPNDENELSIEVLDSIFEQLSNLGVFVVRLAGGEPLIHSKIDQVLKLINKYPFEKMMLTNGVFLSASMAKKLATNGIESLGISIDGHTPELYTKHRGGKKSFQKVISNLVNLRKEGISYSAMTVVSAYNVNNLIDIVKFVQRHGFSSIKFIILAKVGKATENEHYMPSFSDWETGFLKLNNWLKKNKKTTIPVSVLPPHEETTPYEMYLPLKKEGQLDDLQEVWDLPPVRKSNEVGCEAGKTQMTIFENGDIYGCDLMKGNKHLKAGNVHNTSLKEIWNDSTVFERLRSITAEDIKGPCSQCPLDICGGGCRAAAIGESDDFTRSDFSCHCSSSEVGL